MNDEKQTSGQQEPQTGQEIEASNKQDEQKSRAEEPGSAGQQGSNVGTVTGGLIGAAIGGLTGGRIGAAAGAALGAVAGAAISGQNPVDRAKEAIDSVTGGQNPIDRAKEALTSVTGGQNPIDRVKEAASDLKESIASKVKQEGSPQETQPTQGFSETPGPLEQVQPASDDVPQGETGATDRTVPTQTKTPGVSDMVEAAYENAMEMEQPNPETKQADKPA